MKKLFIILCSIMASLIILTGCTGDSYRTVMYVEKEVGDSYSASYKLFDGTRTKLFTVKDGEKYTVSFDIVTNSGELDISLDDDNGNNYYKGTAVSTSKFSVDVDNPGDYTIKFTAREHSGKYEINYNK